MSLILPLGVGVRRNTAYGVAAFVVLCLIGLGIFAKNGWFPSTDPMTGKKTGWFGKELPKNASSSWNPLAAPLPTPTPQLSKEYVYAGSRLLAVEDANANAAPPADLAVWRPSNGTWYVLGGPGSQQTIAAWGTSGDIPVPGDFDGDGKTDFSIYRNSTGTWWVYYSSNGTSYSAQFGASCSSPPTGCDFTAQADYDGDGKTDPAVWRPSTGYWYIYQSSNGQVVQAQFGASGDIPAPADYDGDGKADIAVWRYGTTPTFYAYTSSSGQTLSAAIGSTSSDKPVPADYDGDGRSDFAVKSGNSWIILQSSNNQFLSVTWQNSGDLPVQNDYDGDGKCDIAVWRPVDSPAGTLGNWYIRNSHDLSTRTQQWGTTSDIPVPAYYRR